MSPRGPRFAALSWIWACPNVSQIGALLLLLRGSGSSGIAPAWQLHAMIPSR